MNVLRDKRLKAGPDGWPDEFWMEAQPFVEETLAWRLHPEEFLAAHPDRKLTDEHFQSRVPVSDVSAAL